VSDTPEFAAVHAELLRIAHRELARHRASPTLETRALVNEVYLKLYDRTAPEFASREHLLRVGAQAMRQIIVDHARARLRDRRGGGAVKVDLDALESQSFAIEDNALHIVGLSEAMERLGTMDARMEKVVELRIFGGLEVEEVAEVLGISAPTVKRDMRAALAFLKSQL